MPESVEQLIGKVIGPPPAPAPAPVGLRAIATEPLEALIGRMLAAPGVLGGPLPSPASFQRTRHPEPPLPQP